MNRFASRFIACLAVLLLSSAAFAQTSAVSPVTSTAMPETAEFQKLEDNWSNAINIRDQYALELVLSPLFVDVAATGDITTRNQQVAALISSNSDKTIQLEQKVITVRPLGDIAVVNGTYTLHHKTAAGPTDEKGVFTHVFQKVRGGWVCVNSQRTAVREDAPGKKQKSPSTADQPFHIPFFTKDKKN